MLDEYNMVVDDVEQFRVNGHMAQQRRLLLNISLVSKKWREISLGYSVLWSNLLITPSTKLATVEMWLRRSQESLLNIVFDIRRYVISSTLLAPQGDPVHLSLLQIIDTVHTQIYRCRSLSITTNIDTDMQFILSALHATSSAPKLQQLRLCQSEDEAEPDSAIENVRYIRLFDENTPELVRVRLSGIPLIPTLLTLCRNLTDLSLRHAGGTPPDWMDITSIFTHSKYLHNVSLWGIPCEGIPPFNTLDSKPQLNLHHLCCLSIGNIEMPFAVAFFKHICMSALQSLTLSFEATDCDILGQQLVRARPGTHSVLTTVLELDVTGLATSIETGAAMWLELNQLESVNITNSLRLFYGLLSITTNDFLEHQRLYEESASTLCHTLPKVPHLSSAITSGIDILAISTFATLRKYLNVPMHSISVFRHDFRLTGNVHYIARFVDNLNVIEDEIRID